MCSNAGTRHHLKNVYSALALTMLAAGVGAVAYFYMGPVVSNNLEVTCFSMLCGITSLSFVLLPIFGYLYFSISAHQIRGVRGN